jgi:drug/metabolite transporter (DMT)-like permease
MAEIPIVAIYAYIFLGETMSVHQMIGAALVIVGVLMLSWPHRWRRKGLSSRQEAETERG